MRREDPKNHPKQPLAPDGGWICLGEFLPKRLRLTDTPAGQPEGFLGVQTALRELGHTIAKVRFQFPAHFGGQTGLRGQLLLPIVNGAVQIETGLIFHNLPSVLWTVSHCRRSSLRDFRPFELRE